MKWNTSLIKQCEIIVGEGALSDERSLFLFSQDFGKLTVSPPSAIFNPQDLPTLQKLVCFANQRGLPITLRSKGLSQSGQSLSVAGGITVHLEAFNHVLEQDNDSIWVESGCTWAALLEATLAKNRTPFVIPYNCDLTVGGVLSAGGIGSSSFKYGSVVDNLSELEVLTADGNLLIVDAGSDLFHACLGGQGRFGIMTKAKIKLRPCHKKVRTFFLLYDEQEPWLDDLNAVRAQADFVEFFCTPSIQGAKLSEKGRFPFAQWFFALHLSLEYDDTPPDFHQLNLNSKRCKLLHTQDEEIKSYLHRHDSRFNAMKVTGQWDLQHPWYECFLPSDVLFSKLSAILASLPVHYATIVQVAPVANRNSPSFFMLPNEQDIYSLMILNPGLPESLIPSCLETIKRLGNNFLDQGGKRYLSGYLGSDLENNYWQRHFDNQYPAWMDLKQRYDPKGIFCSLLHKR